MSGMEKQGDVFGPLNGLEGLESDLPSGSQEDKCGVRRGAEGRREGLKGETKKSISSSARLCVLCV